MSFHCHFKLNIHSGVAKITKSDC